MTDHPARAEDLPDDLPVDVRSDIRDWLNQPLDPEVATFPVEQGYIWTVCAATENGNPLFWEPTVAAALTGGPIAPPTMLSAWFRPHHWSPLPGAATLPLQLHFDLKARLALPEAVISDNTLTLHDPVRVGDILTTCQRLRSISAEKTTRLGVGRFWRIDVEYRNQDDDLVGIDSLTGYGYRR